MGSYKNFQSKSAKHTRNRHDRNEAEFVSHVSARGEEEQDHFMRNLHKYRDFVSWGRFYPDLFFDLITPETGGIRLDLDQRVLLRCISRFISTYGVFPRGYGKCLTGDTLLFTEEGVKEIGKYFDYDDSSVERFTNTKINLVNRYGELERTNAGVYSGYQKTKRIVTEEGYEIEGTYNHPILIINKDGDIVWKKMKDINKDDYVIISRKNNVWGNKIKLQFDLNEYLNGLSNYVSSKIINNNFKPIYELDEEFARLIGCLIGDGCLTRNNVIMFSSKDDETVQLFKKIFENRMNLKVRQVNEIDYVVHSKLVREYFRQIGLGVTDAFGKEVPYPIMEAPKNIVSKFLQGLFDTDGGISGQYIEYCTASEKLSKQVQILLLNFGIISTRKKKYNKRFNTYSYRITIYSSNVNKFRDEIGFSIKRKQDKLNEICNIHRNPNKDVIPYQKNRVSFFIDELKSKDGYSYKIKHRMYHVLKGDNHLTYEKLNYLLNLNSSKLCNKYSELKELNDLHYFYSKVNIIEDNENHVYDLSLPKTHSFVSNGFISHNTFIELLAMYHTAIFYPDIELSMTAQTRENAAKLVEEKHREIIRFYPLLNEEIQIARFSKDSVEIVFTSGGRIDVLANAQSTKGARRKRLNVEEAAQVDAELFQDVLEPVVNIPRRTIGKKALVNPEEMNGQINFFTTSWFRGTSEFERNIRMYKEMVDLKGVMVLGADWQLANAYGRGETKSQILAKKERLSPTYFALNYESRWVGASEGALIDVQKLMDLRVISTPEYKSDGKSEYILSMDVARSDSTSNNQSSIAVFKLNRAKNGKIKHIRLVNLINLPNGLTFTQQALELKRIKQKFQAKKVVIDGNGLGTAIIDEVLKETFDPQTGESLGCWDTINTDREPEVQEAEKIVYDLHAQGINSDIIINFIDMVESQKLLLLEKVDNANYDINNDDDLKRIAPFFQTDILIEEIANLKLKKLNNGKYSVEQVVKKIDKDRYSATAYGLWFIKNFEDESESTDEYEFSFFFN